MRSLVRAFIVNVWIFPPSHDYHMNTEVHTAFQFKLSYYLHTCLAQQNPRYRLQNAITKSIYLFSTLTHLHTHKCTRCVYMRDPWKNYMLNGHWANRRKRKHKRKEKIIIKMRAEKCSTNRGIWWKPNEWFVLSIWNLFMYDHCNFFSLDGFTYLPILPACLPFFPFSSIPSFVLS